VRFAVSSAEVGHTYYLRSNLTIDGGASGVTLLMPNTMPSSRNKRALAIEGPASNIIITKIRFQGSGAGGVEQDLIGMDGTGGAISRVVVDRCTFVGASDGAVDITGNVSDVSIQHSLFYDNRGSGTMLIKYPGPPGSTYGKRITLHHNVFTNNGERNPQLRGGLTQVDMVANVVHRIISV
jgi:pectate lyase